jgi:formylglycine-generating enzyme required for sulfatase activity
MQFRDICIPQKLIIGKYEITYKEFEAFIVAGGYNNPVWWSDYGWAWKTTYNISRPTSWHGYLDGSYPPDSGVEVNFPEAEAFCNWLGGRLPTEAEWERASRGDNDHRVFPWGDEWHPEYLVWYENPLMWHDFAPPVGTFSPQGDSPWGLADCAGGQAEFCSDWWQDDIYEQYAQGDFTSPLPPSSDETWVKVRRNGGNGSFYYKVEYFRCAHRRSSAEITTWTAPEGSFRIAFDG